MRFFATSDDNENLCISTDSNEPFHCLYLIVDKARYHAINKKLLRFATVFARSYSVTGGTNRIHDICVVLDSNIRVMFHDITDP
jgi:hypothetical protein